MKDFLKGLVVAAAASAFVFFGAIGVEQTIVPHTLVSTSAPLATAAPSYGAFNPTGGGTYYLSSTISSSQTTVKLSSFTEPTSGTPYTMAYLNSSIEYATIAPQTSQSEFVSFTGITQNADGSATLTGVVRGLSRSYPYTASATFALPHAGQSRFILSDAPQVFNSYASLSNTQTFTGVNTFGSTTPPRYDADPVWANFSTQIFADVAYVNSVVAAGAANASETVKGIIQLATGAQAASGTSLGSTGARLALGNNLATSTPYNSGTNVIPVTGTSEKLSQLFLDLTQTFSWSALHTFTAGLLTTASSTLNATTTIAASSVTNNALKLNTVPLQFPSSQCAAGQVWINNGSGVLSCGTLPSEQYSIASTSKSSIFNNVTITSAQLSIPAGVLTASSTVTVGGVTNCSTSGSGGTCTLSLLDTNSNTYCILTIGPGTSAANNVSFLMNVFANGSLSSQTGSYVAALLTTPGTDLSTSCSGSVNWANAVNFEVRLTTSNSTGVSATLSPFTLTVRP